jgi:hypothetical protein
MRGYVLFHIMYGTTWWCTPQETCHHTKGRSHDALLCTMCMREITCEKLLAVFHSQNILAICFVHPPMSEETIACSRGGQEVTEFMNNIYNIISFNNIDNKFHNTDI